MERLSSQSIKRNQIMINQDTRIHTQCAILLFSIVTLAIPFIADSAEIEWEIENRFRLLDNSKDAEDALYSLAMISDSIKGGLNYNNKSDKSLINKINEVVPNGYFGFYNIPSTRYNSINRTYDSDYTKEPSLWKIKFYAKGISESAVCSWLKNGKQLNGTGNCKGFIPDVSIEKNADIELHVDGILVNRKTIVASDILVVAIGDSYISGEGTPDVPSNGWFWPFKNDAKWFDKKCHVSLLAWPSLVAARLAADNPHKSVTFVTRACSGSETTHLYKPCEPQSNKSKENGDSGKIDCYRGAEKNVSVNNRDYLEQQIRQLRGDLCLENFSDGDCMRKYRQPDLVLVSAGGNDVGFSNTIIASIKERIDNNDDNSEKEKGIRIKYKEDVRKRLESLWNTFSELADSLLATASGFPKSHIVYAIYPDPLMRDGKEGKFCGTREDGLGNNFLGLLGGTGIIQYIFDIFGKRESSQEIVDIRDDFVMWLTGSVALKPNVSMEWEHLGLRGMNIGIQCALDRNIWPFPVGEDLRKLALDSACEYLWGSNGFGQFTQKNNWRFVLLRNEDKNNIQLPGYVTNGYCKPENDVTGRWFRVTGDALKTSDLHGTLHPNIYGQLYYVNRVLPAVRSALGLVAKNTVNAYQ
ncbi:hypothetical protein CCP4SC76_1550019 [Gammaproteobacteria bacterium]